MTIQALRKAPLYNPMSPAAFTAPPVLFEPPAALTDGRHEVWVLVGGADGWGGCHVWGSIDNASYDHVGTILRGSVVGVLISPLPATDDPDDTSVLHVDVGATRGTIHPGSDQYADLFVTLCRVGEELIAHTAAVLVGPHEYRMGRRLRRGAFGTPIADHPVGTQFAKISQSVFRIPYPGHWARATLYAKFPSFNEFGLQQQGLDEVPAYSVTLTGVSGS